MSDRVFDALLQAFASQQSLPEEHFAQLIEYLADTARPEAYKAALTAAWKLHGYCSADLIAIAKHLQMHYLPQLQVSAERQLLDCCGTGGDGHNTFNISTASAVLASRAEGEFTIAKHCGGRTTSQSSSLDFLAEMGQQTLSEATEIQAALDRRQKLMFIASPVLGGMLADWKKICARLEFAGQTGLIGTLTNPLPITHQVLGVRKREWLPLMLEALRGLGRSRVAVVHAEPGLDELAPIGLNYIHTFEQQLQFTPAELGLQACQLADLQGGDARHNASRLQQVLSGQEHTGALADTICLNTGLILWLIGRADSIPVGIQQARALLRA